MKPVEFNNVLVLAPHTDDGELGCGGMMARLGEEGARVQYAAFSTAEQSVPEGLPPNILKTEVREATRRLGIAEADLHIYEHEVRKLNYARQEILEELVRLREANDFDLVLAPALQDLHQDHHTVAEEAVRAFKGTTIWGYELIWNNLSFNTQAFVELGERHVEAKVEALAAYASQRHRAYMDGEFIWSQARVRGVQIGVSWAECFEVVRLVCGPPQARG
ncbi:MAG: PIG-L deacetylase family protein [Verrucomicrobiota bacterium]|nr:PIG-L deacetylase family protein [Verrucomicrobiota bacterium]